MDPFDSSRNANPSSYDPTSTKGPKRKRLAKACDACHKSKRRCDGTALCSNCYHASKPCTYTDATGRSVPAPRQDPADFPDDRMRKKVRPETELPHTSTSSSPSDLEHPPRSKLEPSMTREMTNLFFAHCHLAVSIIHRPTFTSSLAHPGLVPPFLLLAIYALAAPHSRQLALRTSPARLAGKRFAAEAAALMYDSDGSPALQPSLQVAQATCLLLLHETRLALHNNFKTPPVYRDSTLRLLQTLHVYAPEHSLLTPVTSKSHVNDSIQKECIRRMFWVVYFLDCFRGVYGPSNSLSDISNGSNDSNDGMSSGDSPDLDRDGDFAPMAEAGPGTDTKMRMRLPADETSFELAAVHSTLPEYLYLPAVRTQYASELGHLIRVMTIYKKAELAVDSLFPIGSAANVSTCVQAVTECCRLLDEWSGSLPPHLKFNEENLNVQLSMLMTPSSTGSWCYAGLHVIYASCSLALEACRAILEDHYQIRLSPMSKGQSRLSANSADERRNMYWAVETLYETMNKLASATNCGFLLGSILWSLVRYCERASEPRVLSWVADYQELSGASILKLLEHRIIPRGSINLRQPPASNLNELSSNTGSSFRTAANASGTAQSTPSYQPPTPPDSTSRFHCPSSLNSTTVNATLPSLKASGLLDWNSKGSGPRLPPIDFLADNWQ